MLGSNNKAIVFYLFAFIFQTFRAAFEVVSKLSVRPINRQSLIDVRITELPAEKPVDDFDPLDHREPKAPIKPWMAYFNLMRTLWGAGVLGLPLAVSQAGIILGPIMTTTLGLLIIHMHMTLLWCLNEMSRQLRIPYLSYRYGFRIALLHGPRIFHKIGKKGPMIISVFMLLSQLGICTVFVIFTSDSLRDIMDWKTSKPAMLSLLIPYLLLEYFMKTLSIVSYISMLGNYLNMAGLLLIVYHIFLAPHGLMVHASTDPLALFFVIGTTLFNLSAVAVILSIDKALKDPKVLTKPYGMLTVGMFIPTVFTTLFGVLGYWSFGTMEENVLRYLPFDDYVAMASIGLYLVAVAFAFPIQCYPAISMIVDVIKNWHPNDPPTDETLKNIETAARPLFVLTSFFICYLVPIQGAFVAFVGNLCTTMLAFVFPAMMELCILYPNDYGYKNVYLIKDIIILIFGLTSFLFGVPLCGYLIYVRIMSFKAVNNVQFY